MTLMQDHQQAKQKHPGMVLLFRIGDFYEVYGEDAEIAGEVLGLSLTTRKDMGTGQMVLMAAFPHQLLEGHLHRLLKMGHRVAICVQEPAEKIQPNLFSHLVPSFSGETAHESQNPPGHRVHREGRQSADR